MNKLNQLFENKKNNILSIYYTAGYPSLNDTTKIAMQLQKSGVDMIEIGFPFSDPVADGPVIQKSSKQALDNGMNLKLLFDQLAEVKDLTIPRILMGYINPVLSFGVGEFVQKCAEVGVDGVIIPDLPLEEYAANFQPLFEKYGLHNILLVSPETPDERIKEIAKLSSSFIYLVSSNAITGSSLQTNAVSEYFNRVKSLVGDTPLITGFGIRDRKTFQEVCAYTNGAIIGTAFIDAITGKDNLDSAIDDFVKGII
ncbi:MAG: tryptophan synthase subunit alpha [Salinivirgaceae bacterium]|nr:MAG: tryptophan synthase subunit alpha [Salinivirgaceae bacterium]